MAKKWSNTGTVQLFKQKKTKIEVEDFYIHVNNEDKLKSGLPKFQITNVQEKLTTLDNPYFVACCAAYLSTYLCGISSKHFTDNTSPLISSISTYHLYYHMERFLRSPEKLKQHMTDKHFEFVEKHIPVKYKWTWEFDQTKEIYWLWLKKKHNIKDWYSTKSKYGGQIGFHYLQRR